MQTTFIKFTTQTEAQRAQRVLNANGMRSTLKRNPNPNHKEGCSYALYPEGDLSAALRLIETAKIAHKGTERLRDRS